MSIESVTFTVELAVDCAAWRREYDTDEPNSDIVRVVQERMLYRAQDALGPGVQVFSVRREPQARTGIDIHRDFGVSP